MSEQDPTQSPAAQSEAPATETDAKAGDLGVALATWLFILDDSGHRPADEGVRAACDALREGSPSEVDALGQALVAAVEGSLGADRSDAAVKAWAEAQLGETAVGSIGGSSRDERLRHMRAYQFRTSLPFIARIIDRFPGGEVGSHWVMIERVTDTVTCMDPYPWDDLDEEYDQPVTDFMVKWELAGCTSLTFLS
jgi:hypothetical protein